MKIQKVIDKMSNELMTQFRNMVEDYFRHIHM